LGKGHRPRACPFGDKTGLAIERYLRERNKHALAKRPELWLGARGVLTGNGITQMLRRRAPKLESITYIRTCSATPSPTAGLLKAARSKTSCGLPAGAVERCSPAMARVLRMSEPGKLIAGLLLGTAFKRSFQIDRQLPVADRGAGQLE
jgi:hypothetical protein